MRLILVRHGQTSCNQAEIWHGWDDCTLTETGLAQAQAVGARLASEPVAAVYSSDSPRALQTAAAVAAPHGLEPIPDARLRERKAGVFEGVRTSDVVERHPTVWEDRAADYWGWRPPEGESFREVLDRALLVVGELRSRHADDTVVIVSHMGVTRALISRLADVPLEQTYEMPFPSTGVSIFQLDGDGARVEALNDAAHL